jgi:hypothetical protein
VTESIDFLQLHIEYNTNSDTVREAVVQSIKSINALGFEVEQEDGDVYIFCLYEFESFQHTAESIQEELKLFKDAIFDATLLHMRQVTSEVLDV